MKYSKDNKPLVCMQTNSSCYKSGQRHTIRGILIHSTGANNPYISRYVQPSDNDKNKAKLLKILGVNKNHNDWNHIATSTGVHAWIGRLSDNTVATVQSMPYEYKPWGCGSGSRGSLNNGWIQFEICEDNLKDEKYFNKVYKEACEFVAYLCKLYKLDPNGTTSYNGIKVPVITCHNDAFKLGVASGHSDVNHWFPKFGKSVATLRKDVANLLSDKKESPKKEVAYPSILPSVKDTDEVIWNWLKYELDNVYGVSAFLGIMKVESNLKPDNVSPIVESKLKYTGKTYIEYTNRGSYKSFISDDIPFGLLNSASSSRKNSILKQASKAKMSVSDLKIQLQVISNDIRGSYKSLFSTIKKLNNYKKASELIYKQYVNPSGNYEEVKSRIEKYSKYYFDKFAKQDSFVLKAGAKVKLKDCPCFTSSSEDKAYTKKTQEVYIWSDEVVLGKVMVTTEKSGVGKKGKVTCWVKVSDIIGG